MAAASCRRSGAACSSVSPIVSCSAPTPGYRSDGRATATSWLAIARGSINCRRKSRRRSPMAMPRRCSRRNRGLDRKTGAAPAGSGGVRIDDAEGSADQVVDEINLRSRQERHRGGIDQHHRALTRDHEVILGLGVVDVELVLEAGAAAALDADAQHSAFAFALEDFADAAGSPLADGDGSSHSPYLQTQVSLFLSMICWENRRPLFRIMLVRHTQFIWYPAPSIVKCADKRNQMDKD